MAGVRPRASQPRCLRRRSGRRVADSTDGPASETSISCHRAPGPIPRCENRVRARSAARGLRIGADAVTQGRFVVNVRDAEWWFSERRGARCTFESEYGDPPVEFAQVGINVSVLQPGQTGLYRAESNQEAFLVLSGECALLVEDGSDASGVLGLLPRTAYSRRPLYDSAGRLGRRPPATDRAAATQARPSLRDVAAVVLSLASGSRYRRLLSPSTMWAVSSTGPSEPKNSFPSCDAWSDQPYRSVSSSCARRSSCRSGSDSAASFGARRRLRNGHMLSVSTDEGGRIRKGWRENTRWTVPRQPVAHRLGWPNPSRLPVG